MSASAIPDACPGCGQELRTSGPMRPAPRLQGKAVVVVALGSLATVFLAFLALAFFSSVVYDLIDRTGLKDDDKGLLMTAAIVLSVPVVFAPALACARVAVAWPRVLRLRCLCGWAGSYPMKGYGRRRTGA